MARVRAQLLHILYELGHEDHQFRLRFKGQYLRDAYTIEDYAIVENAIIKMVPHSRREEVDLRLIDFVAKHKIDLMFQFKFVWGKCSLFGCKVFSYRMYNAFLRYSGKINPSQAP